jgi:hypothetical protein
MDIICPRCLEPWDSSYVQHEMTPEEREDLQTGKGCSCACRANPPSSSEKTAGASAALQLRGEDLDGAAALTENFGLSH